MPVVKHIDEDADEPEEVDFGSSKGWALGNRVKPDVVAPGYSVLSTKSPEENLSDPGDTYTENDDYEWRSGTSMAAPRVAGASAVIVEWYKDNYGYKPSPAMVKALLINTANDLQNDHSYQDNENIDHIPNRYEGWGIVDISKLERPKDDPVPFVLKDQNTLLQTGQTKKYHIGYDRDNKPLKISLVWTDEEGTDGSSEKALINDLDLKVISPNGDTYLGNAFDSNDDGVSDSKFTYPGTGAMGPFDPDDDSMDDRNNVENVYINSDDLEPGSYTIIIEGENIPADANNDDSDNQDFALVAYNALSIPPVEITNPPVDGWETFVSEVTVEWNRGLSISNLDHFEIKLAGDSWTDVGTSEQYTYKLSDGWYTVYVREYRNDHVYSTREKSFQVDTDGGPMR